MTRMMSVVPPDDARSRPGGSGENDQEPDTNRIAVILPTLDERENVAELIPGLLRALPGLAEIVVVDDGSTDGTPELVAKLARDDGRIRLIERRGVPNLTASIQAGIDASTSNIVAWLDADQSMAPEDLERLVSVVRAGADVAVGSRFTRDGRMKGQRDGGVIGRLRALGSLGNSEDSWVGVALSWVLNAVVLPVLLAEGVHDYTSGFIAARRAVLERLPLRGTHGEYFIDLWMRSRRAGYRIEEVGYVIKPRMSGRSKTANSFPDYARRSVQYMSAALAARRAR
jgi:dolichol-phosphate mannosyltransferase